MLNSEIKWIEWNDPAPQDDGSPAMASISVGIGEKNKDGADLLQLTVCDPDWIELQLSQQTEFWPRGTLVVQSLDINLVRHAIAELIKRHQSANTWDEFAERLNRYLLWEFEDYRQATE